MAGRRHMFGREMTIPEFVGLLSPDKYGVRGVHNLRGTGFRITVYSLGGCGWSAELSRKCVSSPKKVVGVSGAGSPYEAVSLLQAAAHGGISDYVSRHGALPLPWVDC